MVGTELVQNYYTSRRNRGIRLLLAFFMTVMLFSLLQYLFRAWLLPEHEPPITTEHVQVYISYPPWLSGYDEGLLEVIVKNKSSVKLDAEVTFDMDNSVFCVTSPDNGMNCLDFSNLLPGKTRTRQAKVVVQRASDMVDFPIAATLHYVTDITDMSIANRDYTDTRVVTINREPTLPVLSWKLALHAWRRNLTGLVEAPFPDEALAGLLVGVFVIIGEKPPAPRRRWQQPRPWSDLTTRLPWFGSKSP